MHDLARVRRVLYRDQRLERERMLLRRRRHVSDDDAIRGGDAVRASVLDHANYVVFGCDVRAGADESGCGFAAVLASYAFSIHRTRCSDERLRPAHGCERDHSGVDRECIE